MSEDDEEDDMILGEAGGSDYGQEYESEIEEEE